MSNASISARKSKIFEYVAMFLASFLIFYHAYKLYAFGTGADVTNTEEFLNAFNNGFPVAAVIYIQTFIRVVIVASLIGVIFNKKFGLLGMWLGITALIATQFILSLNVSNPMVESVHSGLGPLRGFIFPTLITILYQPLRNRLRPAAAT